MLPAAALVELVQQELRERSQLADHLLAALISFMLASRTGEKAQLLRHTHGSAAMVVKHLIDTRFAQQIGYREFIRASGLTRSHLCTMFSRVVGLPPTEYLLQVRMQQAQRLLRSSSAGVAEIGLAVGIPDANYFSRIFRSRSGMAPGRFRERFLSEALGSSTHGQKPS